MSEPRSADWDVVIIGGGIAGAGLGAEIAAHRRTLIVEAEEQCGYHSTGRSAAFWLESYGGPQVALLTGASRPFLENPPPDFADAGFLRTRGAVHLTQDAWAELSLGVAARRLDRGDLESLIPGLRPQWRHGVLEPGCADIDVSSLHAAYLRQFRRAGGEVRTGAPLARGSHAVGRWTLELSDGATTTAEILVNAAGAWADQIARLCDVGEIGIAPKRRTMVQLRVGRSGLRDLPLIDDEAGTFYFKGEGDSSVWLSPHDEIATGPCDAAPEEIDIATAVDRFEQVVDWPVERVERSWAGLRSFAPDRLPVYGFDPGNPAFFWCAGQGGFGIQTSPAAAWLGAALLLRQPLPAPIAHIDAQIFTPSRFG